MAVSLFRVFGFSISVVFSIVLTDSYRQKEFVRIQHLDMVKHLEPDYEVDRPISTYISHFWDTIDSLGGWIGLTCILIGVILFYFTIEYIITSSRIKREQKKKK
jgi:hypothetical protein